MVPDRSISIKTIKEARALRSRRYRNRRLGDFLNGLNLSEGWATGIPTIQNELEKNGSPYATIETDEDRTFFLIDIPCHPDFLKEEEVVTTLSQPASTLYQAWVSAMEEVTKNDSTDSTERILTFCLNLVPTSDFSCYYLVFKTFLPVNAKLERKAIEQGFLVVKESEISYQKPSYLTGNESETSISNNII